MRVLALGAYRMAGTAKTSGKAYDMGKLIIQQPIEIMANNTMQRTGYGYQATELDAEPEAIAQMNFKFPCELDLEVGQKIAFGRLQAIVIGAKVVTPIKSAA